MNNLVQIKEKIKKAERLHQAQLLFTKNAVLASYSQSIYKKRLDKLKSEM